MNEQYNTKYHKFIPERLDFLNEQFDVIDKLYHQANVKVNPLRRTGYAHAMFAIELNAHLKDTVMITAGCHGREPLPVYAMYKFLEEGTFPQDKRVVILPCINVYGFLNHLDENQNDLDINSSFVENVSDDELDIDTVCLIDAVEEYNPRIVMNMHQDPDVSDFYVYAEGNTDTLAAKLVDRFNEAYVAKWLKRKDHYGTRTYERNMPHDVSVANGIVCTQEYDGTSFEDYLTRKGIPNLCTELPGSYWHNMKDLIAIQLDLLQEFIKNA